MKLLKYVIEYLLRLKIFYFIFIWININSNKFVNKNMNCLTRGGSGSNGTTTWRVKLARADPAKFVAMQAKVPLSSTLVDVKNNSDFFLTPDLSIIFSSSSYSSSSWSSSMEECKLPSFLFEWWDSFITVSIWK